MKRVVPLETISVVVPEHALEAYEAALAMAGQSVSLFLDDEDARTWRVEAVREAGAGEPALQAAIDLASLITGFAASLTRQPTEADGWLARTVEAFPEQRVGRRFAVRGSHVDDPPMAGRITLLLDAGLAFGSGEHGSTRGCLRALEIVARRRPRRIVDIGTGSGILAIAAAKLLRCRVLAVDNDPRSVEVAAFNARRNGVAHLVSCRQADGWLMPVTSRDAPYDLVMANILARPLCAMARSLALHLAPAGTAVLSGLLDWQAQRVASAHHRAGLVLTGRWQEGPWTTLTVRRLG